MVKRQYMRPVFLSSVQPGDDPTIGFGNSTTTIGVDSRFTWDDALTAYKEMFYANGYGEETLEAIDNNEHDYFISEEEFYAWFDEVQPW